MKQIKKLDCLEVSLSARCTALSYLILACCISSLCNTARAITAPIHYAYMDTEWYKTQGKFAEQESQRTSQLNAQTIGLYVTNTTAYPATIVLKKFTPGSAYPSVTKEKTLAEGSTMEILGDALDKNFLYRLSATVAQKTPIKPGGYFAGPGGLRIEVPVGIGSVGSRGSKPVTATRTEFISTNKDLAINHPANPKIELVLELSEQQTNQPVVTLRNK